MPLAIMFSGLGDVGGLVHNPLFWVYSIFHLWMLVDAIRREEWLWALFIFLFPVLNSILYFVLVWYPNRGSGPGWNLGSFEFPGSRDRRRIKELQAHIHHLDKAHHHAELGDIYLRQGRLAQAEASYRAAYDRDPEDPDTLAHYGQCLLRLGRPAEARALIEKVAQTQPDHDYGNTVMTLAEIHQALGDPPAAIRLWRSVLESHSYARARVQLAELLAQSGDLPGARQLVLEVLEDDTHALSFQKSKDRVWMRRARALKSKLG